MTPEQENLISLMLSPDPANRELFWQMKCNFIKDIEFLFVDIDKTGKYIRRDFDTDLYSIFYNLYACNKHYKLENITNHANDESRFGSCDLVIKIYHVFYYLSTVGETPLTGVHLAFMSNHIARLEIIWKK